MGITEIKRWISWRERDSRTDYFRLDAHMEMFAPLASMCILLSNEIEDVQRKKIKPTQGVKDEKDDFVCGVVLFDRGLLQCQEL